MKKFILSIAVLAALSTTSCKKAYECTCETTYAYSYEALISDDTYTDAAAAQNEYESENPSKDTYKSTATVEKTSKAAANANCTDTEGTDNGTYMYDNLDADNDDNYNETAVKWMSTSKTDCSLEKK